MIIGPLRERVILQTQSTTQSSTGAATKAWADSVTVWAQITPQTGKEFFEAARNQEETQVRIIIRYSSDVKAIDTSWRVKWVVSPIRYYNIVAVTNHQQRDRMISLACTEGPKDDE